MSEVSPNQMNRRTLAAFTAINMLNYLDRYLVAAALPYIISAFNLTKTEGGYVVAAFVVGYVLFSPVFGFFGDRKHRPRLMALGVALWSIATILSGLAGMYAAAAGFMALVFVRILVGVGEASFGSIAPGFIKDSVADPAKLTTVFSIFFAAVPVGSALGYLLVGIVTSLTSWHVAFFVGGAPGILLALYLLTLGEAPQRTVAEDSVSPIAGVREILKERAQWFAIGGYALNSFALTGIAAFVSTFGISLGFEGGEINRAFGQILVLTGFLGTVGGGKIASILAARSPHRISSMLRFLAVSALIAAPLLAGAIAVGAKTPFLILCFAAELFIFAGTGPVNSVIVLLAPPHLVTLTQGFTILVLNLLGSLCGPVVVGAVADHVSLAAGMQICSVALALSGVVWWLGARAVTAQHARTQERTQRDWALKLFERSPLKRRKLDRITSLLGQTTGMRCLDLGSDNGVISLLLRERGGEWWSADLTDETVDSIRSLVGERVVRTDGKTLPLESGSLDAVVIVDMLEHLADDRALVSELARVLKSGGALIANVPNPHEGIVRRLRYKLGQTDDAHGHLRPGYDEDALRRLLAPEFEIEEARRYGRVFSEIFDTAITFALEKMKGKRGAKGTVVTGADLKKLEKSFKLYGVIAPFARLFVMLDEAVPFLASNMLIARARRR